MKKSFNFVVAKISKNNKKNYYYFFKLVVAIKLSS